MLDVARKAGRHVHVKRELVLRVKVGISEISVHLGVGSRDGEADTRQHVVGGHPVDVVLVDLGAYHDAVFVFVLLALPLACSLLADVLSPARGLIVLGHLVEMHVGVDGACGPTHKRHGASPFVRCGRREASTSADDVVGVVLGFAGARCLQLGDLEGMTLLQTMRLLRGAGVVVVEGRRGGDAMRLARYLQTGRALVGLGLRRRRRGRMGDGADVRNIEVPACFFGAVLSIHLAELDVRGAATEAVLGLAAVYRGEVAVVPARALARLPLRVERLGVGAVGVHVVSSAPGMTCVVLGQALVDARGPGWAAVCHGLHSIGHLPVHRGSGAIGGRAVRGRARGGRR